MNGKEEREEIRIALLERGEGGGGGGGGGGRG